MDGCGRHTGPHHLVIGTAADGQVCVVGRDVPDSLAADLADVVASAPVRADASRPPAALDRCQRMLGDALDPVELSSGPSYLISGLIGAESTVDIVGSGDADIDVLRAANPGNWEPDEWDGLLDGTLGPWAMAIHHDQVIAICHTPARSDQGAEAGVWTHPDFRGRGHAAAVTAAWAAIMAPAGQYLFYSTFADNLSSQRVAARLGLRPIGWLWKLSPPRR